MSTENLPEASMVDMVFPLAGRNLPRDHALGLLQAVQQEFDWLADEPLAGIHPIKLVQGSDSLALLSQRARLLMRLPRRRREAAHALGGRLLRIGSSEVCPGPPHVRELIAHATLYTPSVAAPGDDEVVFMEAVASELQALGVRCHSVCGKRSRRQLQGREITTFSLMLHGLSAAHSLRVQDHGLGPYRLLGCGIFVPHKSAAAVGD